MKREGIYWPFMLKTKKNGFIHLSNSKNTKYKSRMFLKYLKQRKSSASSKNGRRISKHDYKSSNLSTTEKPRQGKGHKSTKEYFLSRDRRINMQVENKKNGHMPTAINNYKY